MRTVIYVDVLFCVNFFVDCMLLYISARLAGGRVRRSRLCLAGALGGADSLVLLLPDMGAFLSLLNMFLTAALMSLISFGVRDRRRLFRGFLWLMLTTLCYGGMMTALWLFAALPGLTVSNGVAYINLSPAMLIGGTVACYAVMSLWTRIASRKNETANSCEVTVYRAGRSVTLSGIIDTGNLLREPFSGYPAAIAEMGRIEPLLDDGFRDDILLGKAPRNARVIPYSSIGGDGLLYAFRPDRTEIKTAGKVFSTDRTYIAVLARGHVSASAEMIVNPDMLDI